MFQIVRLHFACATGPSPGRSHSLHGMSAHGKLLLIWTGGNQIKGRKLEADRVASGDSHDAGADTGSTVPPTSTQPARHCCVPPLGSRPAGAPAIAPPKKTLQGRTTGWGKSQQESGERALRRLSLLSAPRGPTKPDHLRRIASLPAQNISVGKETTWRFRRLPGKGWLSFRETELHQPKDLPKVRWCTQEGAEGRVSPPARALPSLLPQPCNSVAEGAGRTSCRPLRRN